MKTMPSAHRKIAPFKSSCWTPECDGIQAWASDDLGELTVRRVSNVYPRGISCKHEGVTCHSRLPKY